uniref:Uncharacterized protein n=1 Tax=Romanomermis culicivorax TaxID=13658 RepID=A0A915INR3_ROMCU
QSTGPEPFSLLLVVAPTPTLVNGVTAQAPPRNPFNSFMSKKNKSYKRLDAAGTAAMEDVTIQS